MKNIVLLFALAFCFINCENTDDRTSENLPAITFEGKNTFGCKIDGQIFLPKKKITGSQYNNEILKATYTYSDYYFNGYLLSILGSNEVLDKTIKIAINAGQNPLQEGATYPISVNQANSFYASYEHWGKTIDNGDGTSFTPIYEFETNANFKGELQILKLDTINQIIAGQFWYDCKEKNRDSIAKITEGRFDLKYSKDF